MQFAVQTIGEHAADTVYAYNNLASTYSEMDRHVEAERLYRKAVSARTQLYQPGHPNLLLSMTNHARSLQKLQRFAEAEQLLLKVHDQVREHHSDDDGRQRRAVEHLIMLYQQWGRPDFAELWRGRLPDSEQKSPIPPDNS